MKCNQSRPGFELALSDYYSYNLLIGLEGRVVVNGPGDRGSIPGRVIPTTLKMILDTFLLIKGMY